MTTREKPWMCAGCGYVADSVTPHDPAFNRAPRENDISCCLNCGWVYMRHGARWLPMTAAERAALTPRERFDLTRAEAARVAAGLGDLTRGGGGGRA